MPGKLRTKDFITTPINQDWVREQLLLVGTACEWPECDAQAVSAWVGYSSISYVCKYHGALLVEQPTWSSWLDHERWEQFRDMFDFIRQTEMSGGELLRRVEDRPEEIARLQAEAEKETKKLQRQAVRTVRKHLKEGKVGIPDDELAATRGVQSPSLGDVQLVFRVPEISPPEQDPLPRLAQSQPIIPVRLF
jgi:hypothetical protein